MAGEIARWLRRYFLIPPETTKVVVTLSRIASQKEQEFVTPSRQGLPSLLDRIGASWMVTVSDVMNVPFGR